MLPISADLKQNVFYMLLFLISHNAFAIFCVAGIIVGIILSIYKPSRTHVVLLLGFIVLLFAFEYIKHIVGPLREQTINSLVTDKPHNTVTRIVNFSLLRALPLFLPLLGLAMVGSSVLHLVVRKSKKW